MCLVVVCPDRPQPKRSNQTLKCWIETLSKVTHHLQEFPYCPPTLPFPSPPLFFQNHPSPCPWIQCTNYSEITMYLMLKWSNVAFISSGSTASMMWPECVTVSDSLSLDAIYLGGILERLFSQVLCRYHLKPKRHRKMTGWPNENFLIFCMALT